MRRLMPWLGVLLACGRPGTSENTAHHRDDAGAFRGDAQATLAPLSLGMPEAAGFAYRTRAGHAAFRLAREGEANGDWPTVVTRCREAVAADPQHLDAAYLLAV